MICVLGSGSMGCLWAAHLFEANSHSVCFLTTRETLTTNPVTYTLENSFHSNSSQSFSIPLNNHSQLPHIDTLLLCTKSYDAAPAINSLKPNLNANSKVVLFQNGLGSQFDVLDMLPGVPIYAAVTTEGANRSSKDHVIHAGKGITYVGPLNEAAKEAQLPDALQNLSTLQLSLEKDIWKRLWNKLAINCAINPFTALLNCPNGEVRQSRLFEENWPKLRNELNQMLESADYGINPSELENTVFEVMERTSKNISSMLQDVRQNKKTEINDINGFAYRYLKDKSLSHEVNQSLSEAIIKLTLDER